MGLAACDAGLAAGAAGLTAGVAAGLTAGAGALVEFANLAPGRFMLRPALARIVES